MTAVPLSRPPRVLIAKPGLDGHDRGARVVSMALRDAGAEVVYLGLRQTPQSIVAAAEQEDVDVIGLSFLSGAHLPLTRRVLLELSQREIEVPVVVGGTIPNEHVIDLIQEGVAAVYPVGTALNVVVDGVLDIAHRARVGA